MQRQLKATTFLHHFQLVVVDRCCVCFAALQKELQHSGNLRNKGPEVPCTDPTNLLQRQVLSKRYKRQEETSLVPLVHRTLETLFFKGPFTGPYKGPLEGPYKVPATPPSSLRITPGPAPKVK